MKVLRRSLHKEKDRLISPSRQSFHNSSQQPSQPFASLASAGPNPRGLSGPPTMVIKAVSAYKAKRIVELSFQKGDFFHVVGEREDAEGEWFEASNPATGARGLVPKFGFESFGKQPTPQSHTPRLGDYHPSGPRLNQVPNGQSVPVGPLSTGPKSAGTGGGVGSKTQPLYGVVQHDFVAERPDELDAKRGEPIIVIAQSNHEWFVAKPIGRLGGPGLIPVSFVEVQDVTTGKALAPDRVKELIRSAVVPKVEEWKKATAAYKGNSIPLGRFDFPPDSPQAQPQPQSARPFSHQSQSQSQSHSHTSSHSRQHSNTMSQSYHGTRSQQTGSWHGGPHHSRDLSGSISAHPTASAASWSISQSPRLSEAYEHQAEPEPEPGENNQEGEGEGYATVEELRERYGVVVHASVESFHYEQGHFWFHLRAHFSRRSDQEAEEETTVLVLYRLYEDFYDFHTALTEAFPAEAAGTIEPVLPLIPGPEAHVDELVCATRVEELSTYLAELCDLPDYLRECELVYEFLGPREGDVELEGEPAGLGRSQTEAEGEVVEYLSRMDTSAEPALDDLIGRLSTNDTQPTQSRHQHTPSSVSSATGAGGTSTGPPPAFLRIKLYQRQTDDLIAIRAPNDVRFEGLLSRVKERVGTEVRSLRFRDETGTAYASGGGGVVAGPNGARLVAIDNDADLDRWLESGVRLVLYVD
ncbi:hypothetical protein CROQUDRAFT_45208 [Cronartium quercuum f. sp. fusiforme G11]|uniref:Bud emergence protein 1 n=1 Tax=Cronartium quercuum f. sp. fusiforme G11 TaxID=708437 RepID=A0A9P6NLT6_9BASI|nr:hypothetical protein CROQUDRAFT_45208 [Cronartium quercuum f. sp. fusiforme G11]